MSNIPISSLPVAVSLTGEEQVPLVQAGTTKRTTTGAISALPIGQGTANSGISFITVSSSFSALPNSRTLAAASPVTITDNGTGHTIVVGLSFTPGTGTVTSVGLSGGTTGLTISNSPITTSGTMTIAGVLNVSAGGIGTSTLATGLVLIGQGTSPIKVVANATAGYVLTATAGAPTFQAPSGGISSIALSGGTTGLSVTGSPLTSNGTLTLGGFLNGTAIATNTITFTQVQQVAGLSVIGVAGTATANAAAITATAGQTLRSSAGGTTLLFGAPIGIATVRGLQGENNAASSASKYDFIAESVTLVGTASGFSFVNIGTTTCDLLVSGPAVNGRDQSAAFSAGQFLHFYYITNGATIGVTVSSTAPPNGPALPSGYSAFAYAATLRYASSTAIMSTHISGSDVFFKESQVALINGAQTTTFAAVSLSNIVPSNAMTFTLNSPYVGVLTAGPTGSARATVHWSTDGSIDYTTSAYEFIGFPSTLALIPLADITFPNRGQTFYYYTSLTANGGTGPAVSANVTKYRISNGA